MRACWYPSLPLWKFLYTCAFALLFLSGCSRTVVDPAQEDALPEIVDYNFHIKPIISDRCYTCHGPDENTREADLRLDTPDGLFAALSSDERKKSIVPGKAHKSELIKRIQHDDPEEVMPPPATNLTVSDYEVALLQRWIEQGANWKQHWSFIPPTKPTPPTAGKQAQVVNEIDQFVAAQLEQEGLVSSPEASPEQLIRRVAFDLTGLPPTVSEIDAFLADTSPDAYETLVDQLLAKRAFGERMASEWLDIARYADTGGYQSDRLRRMWPWRDWVINAFNENLPYDQFVTWQLAGDLLPNPTQEQVLATAFNRNHRQTEEGGSIEEEFRMEYVADRTNTMSTAFMGMTMECARCHDHKYDPISQKEYFQLFAFFNNIDESGQTSYFTDAVPVPTMLLSAPDTINALTQTRQAIVRKETELAKHVQLSGPAVEAWFGSLNRSPLSQSRLSGLTTHIPFESIANEQTPNLANRRAPGHTVFDPKIVAGKLGRAVQFDGENGLEFKGAGEFERTDPFTVAFWMKATKWNASNALVHRTKATYDAGSRGYEISLQKNQLVAGLSHMWPENAIRVITTDSLTLNTWTHVAMTYNGSSKADGVSLFVNGKEAETTIVRDNLTRTIKYERVDVNLTTGYRFRDTGFQDGLLDELRVYNRALTPLEVTNLAGEDPFPDLLGKPLQSLPATSREAITAFYMHHQDPAYRALHADLQRLRVRENEQVTPIEEMMVMREMTERRPTHILRRGAYDDKGEEVSPGTPAAMLAFDESLPRNRLGLANWLTNPQHPLTARVAVNRFWQMFFEQGLVVTPEDFGSQGALPTHPALLDWLATTFVASGWDVKQILKTIVMSATYRQSSRVTPELRSVDPDNLLLARGPKKRLAAEMIRDNALAASELLVDKQGGPPVKPYQPAGLWKEKSGKAYVRDTGEGLYRRSLYTFWRRTSPPPSMITFDATRRNQCVVRRQQTSTPMQALVLLNDPQYVEASRVLAQRLLQQGTPQEDVITEAFRRLTSRQPTTAEREIMQQTYEEQLAEYSANPSQAIRLLQIGDTAWDENLAPDQLAATTIMVNTVMNYEAAIINR